MEAREQRGLVIAAISKLSQKDGQWIVPSQSASDKRYVVNIEQGTCTCPDHQETGFKCKHQYAVEFTVKREQQADGTVVEQRTFTFTEKKTYGQNWSAYNEAQMTEKRRLQTLLADICKTLPEPPRKGKVGRAPFPIADRVFSICLKVYTTISGRRASCDIADASDDGYLSQPIHPAKISKFFCDSDLTPVLRELVSRTALPLQAIETEFAVDSSGFSVSKFVKWHDEKYVERSGRDWVKAHICTGVTTNCVTAVTILDRDAADSPRLPELIGKTAEAFRVREVSADKAYLSVANVEAIAEHGGTAFIAPKVNSTGAAGGLFEKMIHFYRFNAEEYMAHYHKRSNVESTFSAVKRKFGDSVRAKNPVAMVNEVLAKFICQNLTCVIQSQCELGIEATFFNDRLNPVTGEPKNAEPEPVILRFVRQR